jgi:hypothetical protein
LETLFIMGKVLHASYSGYFPYCIQPYSPNQFEPFFSTSSLENAMRLFWRIRKIRFYGTYQTDLDPPETRNFDIVFASAAGSEEELVCGNPGYVVESSTNIITEGFFSPSFTLEEITSHSGGYVVRLSWSAAFVDTSGPTGFSAANPTAQPASPPPLGTINFEGVQMNGENIPSYEITEFWSYGGTYDTATGLPL